jgi:hypothetical protein
MARPKKDKVENVQGVDEVSAAADNPSVLVTFNQPSNGRVFNAENNEAFVTQSQLKEGQKFVVIGAKNFIQEVTPEAAYLL